ncbi:GNAT family N-acetyltransferase [Sphingomonas aurantiaca]|uniref:GNAT family N-acetyltransferase n=1 Tax=Sphingomonas aurantiaca TaxID=185949 RepID=UPI002FDFF5FB
MAAVRRGRAGRVSLLHRRGESLRYDHVGHDPAHNDLSPGAVLQVEAMRDLFAEARFARFDFTEGRASTNANSRPRGRRASMC